MMTSELNLNHAKGYLRLPLELVSSTCSEASDFLSTTDVITKDLDSVKIENSDKSPKPKNIINLHDVNDDGMDNDEVEINDSILPTTHSGSIDSLSSSSHSASTNNSSPPSFTTFGKEAMKQNDMFGKTQTIIFMEEDTKDLIRVECQRRGKEAIETGSKNIQSSDDDSGFENVVQIKCEGN